MDSVLHPFTVGRGVMKDSENMTVTSEPTVGERRTYDWLHDNMPISHPEWSDEEVAGRVRMLMRDDWSHEDICVTARDRIMCLSKELAEAREALGNLLGANDAVQDTLGDGPDVPGFDPLALPAAQQAQDAAEREARAILAKATGTAPPSYGRESEVHTDGGQPSTTGKD